MLVVDPVVGPVVVQVGGESDVRMSVLWVGTSDVWLRIFLNISLEELVIEVKGKIVIVSVFSCSVFVVFPVVSPIVV